MHCMLSGNTSWRDSLNTKMYLSVRDIYNDYVCVCVLPYCIIGPGKGQETNKN